MQLKNLFLVFRVHYPSDVFSALSKEITAFGRYIKVLVLLSGTDLNIFAGLGINVIKGIKTLGQTGYDLVVSFLLNGQDFCFFASLVFLVNIDYTENKIVGIIIQATDHSQRMPGRDTVYHQTVFDILHAALLHGSQKVFFLDVLYENMLVFFIYDLLAVTDDVLEEVIAALLKTERMEFGIY